MMKYAALLTLVAPIIVGCSTKPTSECVDVGASAGARLTHCYVDNGIRGHGGPVVIDRYAIMKTGSETTVKHVGGAANVGTAQGVLQNLASSVPVAAASVIGDHFKAQAIKDSSGGGTPVLVGVTTQVNVDQENGGGCNDCDL